MRWESRVAHATAGLEVHAEIREIGWPVRVALGTVAAGRCPPRWCATLNCGRPIRGRYTTQSYFAFRSVSTPDGRVASLQSESIGRSPEIGMADRAAEIAQVEPPGFVLTR